MNTLSAKPHLFEMTPEDLLAHGEKVGVPIRIEEARRFLAQLLSYTPATRPPARRPVRKSLAAELAPHTDSHHIEILERVTDPFDKFVKYLFRSPDGALTEAVRIPLHKDNTYSVCLSSQVGCAMACDFCATGRLGLKRNMRAWEIISAFMQVRDEAPGRVTSAVFQGQGEPLHNYDEVIQAARVLSNPCGGRVSGRAITISTVGLVPQIRRFAREQHQYKLIISLTSAIGEKRRQLLPVAGRFSLEEVASAIREYAEVAHDRVTVAWVVMSGVNTGQDEVDELKRLLGDLHLRVNLIDVNDARPDGYKRASAEEMKVFMDRLSALNVPLVRRYSGGAQKHAACGMLASVRWADMPEIDATTAPKIDEVIPG